MNYLKSRKHSGISDGDQAGKHGVGGGVIPKRPRGPVLCEILRQKNYQLSNVCLTDGESAQFSPRPNFVALLASEADHPAKSYDRTDHGTGVVRGVGGVQFLGGGGGGGCHLSCPKPGGLKATEVSMATVQGTGRGAL